jgi:hypothetical protein
MWQWLIERRVISDPKPSTADLSQYGAAFLASGLCLDRAVTPQLLGWVRAGGTLVATLAPGLVDGHTRPDGRILRAVGVDVVQRPLDDHRLRVGTQETTLPRAVTFAYVPTKAFQGKVVARYADGQVCWLETPLGKGRIVLIGFAMSIAPKVAQQEVIPRYFAAARSKVWSVEADSIVEVFERVKSGHLLLFVLNRDYKRRRPAKLIFDRAREITDLRTGLQAIERKTLDLGRMWPGECRVIKVGL